MTLNLTDAIVHSNTGGVATSDTSTPITVELAGTDETEDGNLLLVIFAGYNGAAAAGIGVTSASGWAPIYSSVGVSMAALYRGPNEGLTAGESSWGITLTQSTLGAEVTWQVYELSGINFAEPIDVAAKGVQVGAGASTLATSASATQLTSYDELIIAAHAFSDQNDATPATWSSHTNSFTEIGESGQASGAHSIGLSVSALTAQTLITPTTTATASRAFLTNEGTSLIFGLTAANAARQTDLVGLDGGESTQLGTVTGPVTLDAAAARSGALGYLFSSTAAACNRALPTSTTAAMGSYPAFRFHFQVPDLTDRAQIFYFTVTHTGSGAHVLTGRLTGGQIGLAWQGSAEQLSDSTITADQWVGVEVRVDRRSVAQYKADWSVDYNAELTDTTPAVRQTTAVYSTVVTGTYLSLGGRVGWTSSLTSTMHVDDCGLAPGHNFPLGDLRVLPLKVDPAGTPSTSGATTNFGVMTANGTVAAWNAVNARNAVDDIPPIAAGNGARDAAVALLAHATDTANFPMETYDLAANKVNVRGLKCHWWLWAASATATTIRIFVNDGTDTHTMFAEANPTASNTTQVYGSAMVRASATTPPNWTQEKVNNLEYRFGSNDANPDIGPDAFVLELAVAKALPENLFGQVDEPIYVEAHRDPVTYALVGATGNNNSGEAIELAWEVDGVPDSSGSIPDGTVDQYVPLSPDGTIETVGKVSVIPG